MPWSHCDIPFLLDSENCTSCGFSKAEWTVEFERTRQFVVTTQRYWIELELVGPTGEAVGGEAYRVTTGKGKTIEGSLDEKGFARVERVGKAPCQVSFPKVDVLEGDYAFALTPLPETEPEPELHWLELELVDDRDPPRPVAGEPYRVRLPDGKTIEGTLDEEGRALLEELPPGECTVEFPQRDQRDAVFALALAPPPTPEQIHESGWLEIELVDDRDPARPVPHEDYVIVCSDGSRREGTTDEDGKAFVEGIPPGECDVWFPNRDVAVGVYGFEAPAAGPPPEELPELGWLEVELVDDREPPRPVADEPFRITYPDGTLVEGTTNAQGRVYLDSVPCGLCKVEFPQRDARDGGEGFPLAALGALSKPGEEPELGWIEFELVEEGDPERPLAGEPFRLELADGSTIEGKLDAQGSAYLSEIPVGEATLIFPERQQNELIPVRGERT